MNEVLFATLKYFSGIDNVSDKTRMAPEVKQIPSGTKAVYPLLDAKNVDIKNSYNLETRPGSNLLTAGTDLHSLFANEIACLVVDGTILYSINGDWTLSPLLSGLTRNSKMSYAPLNDKIYLTNGSYIGKYYLGLVSGLAAIDQKYKAVLPAGRIIAVHNATLFVASGKVLYMGDALCEHYDSRYGFKVFKSDIIMVRPVSGGIYVSDEETTWFMEEGEDKKWKRDKVYDFPAVFGTDINIAGHDIKDELQDGRYAIWTSKSGIILGDPNGKVKDLTCDTYNISPYVIGGAVLRSTDGETHYIATLS